MFDYLIVGAGLYGAVCAYELKKAGKKCLVIDKRDHIAGNIYTKEVSGINVHQYGAHIFHTSNKKVWDYVNQFAEFNHYINSPIAVYKDELYNLPFNMNTFSKMWNIRTPQEAKDMIEKQVKDLNITEPKNLEEGDIISFISQNSENFGETVTHKIRRRTTDASGAPGFVTYGTTTDTDDATVVTYPYVLGEYQFAIPKLGTFFNFLKTPQGYIVCIFTPFMLLILYQAYQSIMLFRAYKKEQRAELEEEKAKIEADREETLKMMKELQELKAQMEQMNAKKSEEQ